MQWKLTQPYRSNSLASQHKWAEYFTYLVIATLGGVTGWLWYALVKEVMR